ncbi:MAG: hypothetical protein H7832_03570 [Magnetococcus sp. DMHC-6]
MSHFIKKCRKGEQGFFDLKTMIILASLGFFVTIGFKFASAKYEYYLLTDLANRVVTEFSKDPMKEVERKVNYEFGRSQLHRSKETFIIKKLAENRYRVTVNYHVSLSIQVADFKIPMGQYEEFDWIYEVETES